MSSTGYEALKRVGFLVSDIEALRQQIERVAARMDLVLMSVESHHGRIERLERIVGPEREEADPPMDTHLRDQRRIRELYEWAGGNEHTSLTTEKMRELWPWLEGG